MKALSLSQPWLWAVLHAGKHVENRSWAPPINMIDQRIALHAAKSWDDARAYGPNKDKTPIGFLISLGLEPPARIDRYDRSAIVAIATIDRVVTEDRTIAPDQKRWFFGPYGWLLGSVRLITPIACAGKQGLWTVSDAIAATIDERLAA